MGSGMYLHAMPGGLGLRNFLDILNYLFTISAVCEKVIVLIGISLDITWEPFYECLSVTEKFTRNTHTQRNGL